MLPFDKLVVTLGFGAAASSTGRKQIRSFNIWPKNHLSEIDVGGAVIGGIV